MPAEEYRLPDTLSGLLRVAVQDVLTAEKDPTVMLDMNYFMRRLSFAPEATALEQYLVVCQVCMAGAVMLRMNREAALCCSGPISFNRYLIRVEASGVDAALAQKLEAIDFARIGELRMALFTIRSSTDLTPDQEATISNASKFLEERYGPRDHASWDDYLTVADSLESVGL